MVEQILEECFGEDAFPIGALVQLKLIGRDRCTQNSVTKSVILTIKEGRQGKEPLTWGTVKNYLSAFSHFLDFLEACYCCHNLDVKGMRNVLKGIVRSVNKFVAEEGQRRKLKCREKVIPAELMSKYFEHKIAHTLLKDMKKRGKIQNGKFHAETRERESVRNHICSLLQSITISQTMFGSHMVVWPCALPLTPKKNTVGR
ncbi:hypothetical protein BaRGS_00029216 [Batillaria attramentaria]|uniref:Uncharacterized protein n=1 Tax=Batillaria attramentaria TaxID=370345 RepID=A0ABD0JXM0_9CAEN